MGRIMEYRNNIYRKDLEGTIYLIFMSLVLLWISITLISGISVKELFDLFLILILLALILYHIYKIKIAVCFFLSKEIYEIREEKFFYKKMLHFFSYDFVLTEFECLLLEIESIEAIEGKRIKNTGRGWNPIFYYSYFVPCPRIILTLENKSQYHICHYVKPPDNIFDYWSENKNSEESFQRVFQSIFRFIEEGTNSYQQSLINQEFIKKYLLEVEERYMEILKEILNVKKIYLNSHKETFSLYSPSVELALPDIFNKLSEYDFYEFYLDYLSNIKFEDKIVEVGYNGVDSKKVTMKQLKEDINRLRDSN